MRKEEMISTMNERFNRMTEEGVEVFFNIFTAIPEKEKWLLTTTPERLAELAALNQQRELEEQQQKEEAEQQRKLEREAELAKHSKLFTTIENVHVPTRYDMTVNEVIAIDFKNGQVSRCFPDYAYAVANDYFSYGFLKGARYAKAEAKRSIKKKATDGNQ